MTLRTPIMGLVVSVLLAQGCAEGGGSLEDAADVPLTSAVIGPEGGVVETPQGVKLEVPAGALDEHVTFEITLIDEDPAELLVGLVPLSQTAEIRPSGTIFMEPATITLPWNPDDLPEVHTEESVLIYAGAAGVGGWEAVPTTIEGSSLVGEIGHLTRHAAASGCVEVYGACDPAREIHCCSPATCVGTKCVPCSKAGPITNGGNCCPGFWEDLSSCKACGTLNKSCTSGTSCCHSAGLMCIGGTCQNCLKKDAKCKESGCCGSLHCVNGECSDACGQVGDECTSDYGCCGWNIPGHSVRCAGTKCTGCSAPGGDCSSTWGPDCCSQSFCEAEKCQECKKLDEKCDGGYQCCNLMCEGGQCVSCFKEVRPCRKPSDCCSGECEDDSCLSCPQVGSMCSGPADCCVGDCCEDKVLLCIDEECQDCAIKDDACILDEDCCGKFQCLGKVCQECRKLDESCDPGIPYHCCAGGKCEDNVCVDCVDTGGSCDAENPCCSTSCIAQKCQDCIPLNETCEKASDCCSEDCKNKKCYQCPGFDQPCSEDNPCCGAGLGCVEGTCDQVCGIESMPCGHVDTLPCCEGNECNGIICVTTCGHLHDKCTVEEDCCDDHTCLEGVCWSKAEVAAAEALCEKAWKQYDTCNYGNDSESVYKQKCWEWYKDTFSGIPDECVDGAMAILDCQYGLTCEEYDAGGAPCQGLRDTYLNGGCPQF